jgi:predicted DNA-binding protein
MQSKKKMGRPKKEITKDKVVVVRMTSKMKERLKGYSKKEGLTMSEVIDMSINSFLYNNED